MFFCYVKITYSIFSKTFNGFLGDVYLTWLNLLKITELNIRCFRPVYAVTLLLFEALFKKSNCVKKTGLFWEQLTTQNSHFGAENAIAFYQRFATANFQRNQAARFTSFLLVILFFIHRDPIFFLQDGFYVQLKTSRTARDFTKSC